MISSLRTDSPLSRRIVASFLHFLSTVEAAPGQDIEGVEVAAECLAEVFGIDARYPDDYSGVISLIDVFSAIDAECRANGTTHAPSAPPIHGAEASRSRAVPSVVETEGESHLDQFKDGLELAGFFDGTLLGTPEYEEKLNEAKAVLEEARMKIRSTTIAPNWSKSYPEEILVLAEAFKIQGNRSMSVNEYHTAIQLYTLALSLCSTNAIFHSNRAAALTAIGKYEEAIADCHAAMKLDPLYSKAYSRLGLAYYAQGKLEDAIEKGFKKALELDPSSTSVQENLRAAEQKLEEQQRQQGPPQSSSPRGADNQNADAGFNADSAPNNQLPSGINDILTNLPDLINMAAQFGQRSNQDSQQSDGANQGSAPGGVNQPGGSGNVNQFPLEINNLLTSLPGLITMATQFGQTTATQGSQQSAGPNQGAVPGGGSQPGEGGQEVPGVAMDSMLMNAFQQFFGGSGGVASGGTPNSNPQQGPPRGS
ncbi:hypothetical protein R1flu_025017 [Riccia fluitans]|uniref:SGTA homodimerisation domain-containing protein n=1 Tax=Riccia fluitans TaxID=41844 RepID=A0ABD1XWJ9_9MARC